MVGKIQLCAFIKSWKSTLLLSVKGDTLRTNPCVPSHLDRAGLKRLKGRGHVGQECCEDSEDLPQWVLRRKYCSKIVILKSDAIRSKSYTARSRNGWNYSRALLQDTTLAAEHAALKVHGYGTRCNQYISASEHGITPTVHFRSYVGYLDQRDQNIVLMPFWGLRGMQTIIVCREDTLLLVLSNISRGST